MKELSVLISSLIIFSELGIFNNLSILSFKSIKKTFKEFALNLA